VSRRLCFNNGLSLSVKTHTDLSGMFDNPSAYWRRISSDRRRELHHWLLAGIQASILRLGGVHGDRAAGMQQLAQAVTRGHYLRPYAKLMLALAELREKNPAKAREYFAELAVEFPANPLFA
jgi:hypothetical protein